MESDHFYKTSLNPSSCLSRSEYERAAEQLDLNKDEIKALWEEKVREEIRVSASQTSLALVNSLGIFLDELSVAIAQSDLAAQTSSDKGMAKTHGGERAGFAGYFLPQLLKEFSILREVITDVLNRASVLTFAVRIVIDRTIDAAISSAATEFAFVQQENTEAALKKAEDSNRDLEHFAAIAAHDLKSPVATISGYLDLLLMEEPDTKLGTDALEHISTMQRISGRMCSLIDRLLEYARLSTTIKPFQSVSLSEVRKSVIQNLNDVLKKTSTEIIWDRLPTVKGDLDLLVQLFQNLISNSIKFHGTHPPHIHIESKTHDGMVTVSIKDNGIGFDPKDKEKIFALFKKLYSEAGYQGAGIGLATCRKVVELHGGTIWAESTPGSGSTFFFSLPEAAKNDVIAYH
jgi:signal transduction histidine kinase